MNWFNFVEKLKTKPRTILRILRGRPILMIVLLGIFVGLVGFSLAMLFLMGGSSSEEVPQPAVVQKQPPPHLLPLPDMSEKKPIAPVTPPVTLETAGKEKPSTQPSGPLAETAPLVTPELEVLKPEASSPLSSLLSEQEIFERLFPQFYIDYLNDLQEQLISVGYLKPEERRVFDSLNDIVSFLDREIGYLLEVRTLSQAEYKRLREGLYGDFARLIRMEAEQLRSSSLAPDLEKHMANNQKLLPPLSQRSESAGFCKAREGLFDKLRQLVKGIFGGFVKAQGDCYRQGIGRPWGYNLWAPCCDCKMLFIIPIGCLNAVCPFYPAIWDPMTGICGCG